MKPKKILVPINGSTADRDAVELACIVAKKSKAEVYVVYVIEVKRSLPLDAEIHTDVDKAENILDLAENIAADNDYIVKTDLIQAREAGVAIVDEARERDTDLIIMSLNYKKRFGMFNMGRAIPYVLEEAPCRVILLREPK
jgi:nucleotide-binding universal stress UspA family protein